MQTQLTLYTGMAKEGDWSERCQSVPHQVQQGHQRESINRGIEPVLPTSGRAPYISTLIRWYVGPHNLRRGEERRGWPHIGCWDILLTHKVWSTYS